MLLNLKLKSDIFERTDTLETYYREIRKYPILSKEEEISLFKKLHDGSKSEKIKAKEDLITCNQRFVVAIAKRYANNTNIMDLINEGNIGLIEAIETFNYKRNNKFSSYAVWFIRRQINLFILNTDCLIKKSNVSKTYYIMSSIKNNFYQKYQRYPNEKEIMEILMDEYNIKLTDTIDLIDTEINYISDVYFDEEHQNVNIPLYEEKTMCFNQYENVNEKEYIKHLLYKAISKLNDKEKYIIFHYFGLENDVPYQIEDIAKNMKLSRERVRQIKETALEKLGKTIKKQL